MEDNETGKELIRNIINYSYKEGCECDICVNAKKQIEDFCNDRYSLILSQLWEEFKDIKYNSEHNIKRDMCIYNSFFKVLVEFVRVSILMYNESAESILNSVKELAMKDASKSFEEIVDELGNKLK